MMELCLGLLWVCMFEDLLSALARVCLQHHTAFVPYASYAEQCNTVQHAACDMTLRMHIHCANFQL